MHIFLQPWQAFKSSSYNVCLYNGKYSDTRQFCICFIHQNLIIFMNHNENNDNSNILLGFVLGAAAGLAAGMLLSPDSGEGNRRFIAQKANDLGKKATDLTSDITKKANDLSGQLGTQINDTIGKITKKKSSGTGTTTPATSISTPPSMGTAGISTPTPGGQKKPKGPKNT
jgi:gas vesicle protein